MADDSAVPSSGSNVRYRDLVEAHLALAVARDAGRITEEEFQAAKAELRRPADY